MSKVILDSNIWIAAFNKDDALHSSARQVFRNLRNVYMPFLVLQEVATILKLKAGHDKAVIFLDFILNNNDVTILNIEGYTSELISLFIKEKNNKLSS